jgi:hypothetical protein
VILILLWQTQSIQSNKGRLLQAKKTGKGEYTWLLADPYVDLRQRFVLATFIHATKGTLSWMKTTNWLSYEHHECEWFCFHMATTVEGVQTSSIKQCPCRDPSINYDNAHTLSRFEHSPFNRLWFSGNGLPATLPEDLYWMTSDQHIVSVQ